MFLLGMWTHFISYLHYLIATSLLNLHNWKPVADQWRSNKTCWQYFTIIFIALTGYLRSLWLRMTTVTECQMSHHNNIYTLNVNRANVSLFVFNSWKASSFLDWRGYRTSDHGGAYYVFRLYHTWLVEYYLWGSQPSLNMHNYKLIKSIKVLFKHCRMYVQDERDVTNTISAVKITLAFFYILMGSVRFELWQAYFMIPWLKRGFSSCCCSWSFANATEA